MNKDLILSNFSQSRFSKTLNSHQHNIHFPKTVLSVPNEDRAGFSIRVPNAITSGNTKD